MAPWLGYTRVSRIGDRRETLISPELQTSRIQHYAAGHGLAVRMLEPELDVSGGTTTRPILERAIQSIEAGEHEGIIVAQLDRLSRMELADALATIRRIEAAGGQVIAVAENFDVSTPEGRMSRNVILSLGEMQLERYKRQFRDAKQQAVERGIWPTNTVPVGYRKRGDRRLEPDPKSRAKVVRAFEMRAAGDSWAKIATALQMGQTTISKVVRNRVYLGELRLGEWVNPESHEPLVSRDLFEAAQLDLPRPPRPGNEPALLTGLARCASCGGAMTLSVNRGRHYRCPGLVRRNGRCQARAIIGAVKLETYVEEAALREIDSLSVTAQQRSLQVDVADKALTAAEDELAAYQRAVSVSGIGEAAFLEGMRARVDAVERARQGLAEARRMVGPLPEPGTLRELWSEMSVQERRHVLGGALSAVVVRRGRGPAAERVRLIPAGFGVGDLPSEIGSAPPENVG